ncbi:MAG: hypothetical protein FJX99_02940 [Bacteroidetes bacterium]|nr:hypothetical protein [Bacteroidota bacterium]
MRFYLLLCLSLFVLTTARTQFSVNGGTGFLKGFSKPKYFYGLHIGGELPRSNELTMYARLGYYFPQNENDSSSTFLTAYDFNTVPYQVLTKYVASLSHLTIEGGTRYYLGNGYDNGFSGYGGNCFMIMNSTVKRNYDYYDKSKYALPNGEESQGSILSILLGLQGGVKYTDPSIGTFYLDVTGAYSLLALPSNATAQSTNLYSPLIFNFSIGFRKDFY